MKSSPNHSSGPRQPLGEDDKTSPLRPVGIGSITHTPLERFENAQAGRDVFVGNIRQLWSFWRNGPKRTRSSPPDPGNIADQVAYKSRAFNAEPIRRGEQAQGPSGYWRAQVNFSGLLRIPMEGEWRRGSPPIHSANIMKYKHVMPFQLCRPPFVPPPFSVQGVVQKNFPLELLLILSEGRAMTALPMR